MKSILSWWIVGYTCIALSQFSCKPKATSPPYEDVSHFSRIFGREKHYRLYRPDDYDQNKDRYPVIYFFHGWGGRHDRDDNAKLEYEKIKALVNQYHVLLVMWDGNITESERRPYNIGYHDDIRFDVQMKDYFVELVSHIDSIYRTQNDRDHRGIIGFSMGGFMSYFLAGAYPDKIGAAVFMTGSPEFFVGYPKNHTLYPVRYTFKNLRDVKLRLHNSTKDELTYLNTEVHKGAIWEGGLHYEYWQFEGGHMIDLPGKTEVFEKAMNFVATAFRDPLPKPVKWWHYDLYPEFQVWDYQVKSNKKEPGFIYLNGVTRNGFGISSLQWLPDGPPLITCDMAVTTAAVYQPTTLYNIVKYIKTNKQMVKEAMKSDAAGRLHFTSNAMGYELGIYKEDDGVDLVGVDYSIGENQRYLREGIENKVSVTIFNRGGETSSWQKISVALMPLDSSVTVSDKFVFVNVAPGERFLLTPSFRVFCSKKPPLHGEPSAVKFKIGMGLDGKEWVDELIVPVLFDVPVFESLTIDDGRPAFDSAAVYGSGNADGVAGAGESIMLYSNGHRLRVYTDDPWVEQTKERLVDEVLPAKWPDGYTLSSVIKIKPGCPEGHWVEGVASYETKTFMPIERKLTWGRVRIRIRNSGF